MSIKKVIFVCTGNTCRSPMAQFLFDKFLKFKGVEGVEVLSMGVWADGVTGIMQNARQVLFDRDIKEVVHTSAPFMPSKEKTTIFIGMTRDHKKSMIEIIESNNYAIGTKGKQKKPYIKNIISIYDIIGCDIDDPYGSDLTYYKKTADLLAESCPKLLKYINTVKIS